MSTLLLSSLPSQFCTRKPTVAMSKSNLLVFGATGAIGSYIIAAIVNAKDSFGRIAVFTSPNTLSTKATEINALRENGVEIITGDVTKKEDVVAAFEGAFHPSHPFQSPRERVQQN
jgi:uncharacterized protein YbjT (DUF2867 family)